MKTAEQRVLLSLFLPPVIVVWHKKYISMYDLEHIDKPFNTEIVNLMNEEGIKSIILISLEKDCILWKTGNNAVHYGNRITSQDALVSIRYIYDFTKWFAQSAIEIASSF
jgi:type I restriction enzyme R subunit